MGKKGTSGGGTVRTRKDGPKEARLLVPKEYRAVVGRTYLYFYEKTEREAKDKRSAALGDLPDSPLLVGHEDRGHDARNHQDREEPTRFAVAGSDGCDERPQDTLSGK